MASLCFSIGVLPQVHCMLSGFTGRRLCSESGNRRIQIGVSHSRWEKLLQAPKRIKFSKLGWSKQKRAWDL